MRNRAFILIFLLMTRYILGLIPLFSYHPGRLIRVTGIPINTYQENSNCIIKIDRFSFSNKINCAKVDDVEIVVVGTISRTLINIVKGELWLSDAKLEIVTKTQKLENLKVPKMSYLDNFRNFLIARFKKNVPEPEAGLLAGIVLGYKKDIGQEFYNQMIRSGTIHIAVASGYNILLVGGLVLSISLWFCKRKLASMIAIVTMMFYGLLAGGEPPVIRAIWMASFLFVGKILGRSNVSGWILTMSAWFMLMIDPSLVTSASFQLSVAASFGLMVVEPWINKKFGGWLGGELVDVAGKVGLMTTLSTMLMTLPILWWHFGRMSLIGILSNSLILPFVPVVMMLGSGVLILPQIFAVPAYVFAHWIVVMIRFFGS